MLMADSQKCELDAGAAARPSRLCRTRCQEKPHDYAMRYPYRKPTQVGGHKCAQVYERNIVKELGKQASVPSVYGLPPSGGRS